MQALMYPIATEKAISMIEKDNIITYIVDMRATKQQIKKEFESTFNAKVAYVRTAITSKNKKKATIKLAPQVKASDIAIKLKIV
ncbi:MAG: 50S ribosomal protein L23 [Candidatus Micrarchaeia archaeon]